MDSLSDWLDTEKEFPQPKWDKVQEWVEAQIAESQRAETWNQIAIAWTASICEKLGSEYHLRESQHFILASVAPEKKEAELLEYLERCYVQIRASLPCLVAESPEGKCPVIIIATLGRFYDYLADWMGEEGRDDSGAEMEYGAVGGVYLNAGFGHFVVPSHDISRYQDVFAHELCHALVAPLSLPVWLDEAVAMTVEHSITKRNPYVLDRELIERHQAYWTEPRIQDFWAGNSFWYADEGQELSYHLAQFLLNGLYQGGSTSAELVNEFILSARREDAGVSAARDILDLDLTALLRHFIGDGNWEPALRGRIESER